MKKTLAQKRAEDKAFYEKCARQALIDAENPKNTDAQRQYAMDVYRRAFRAIEVSKLDPIAAHRVFTGVDL